MAERKTSKSRLRAQQKYDTSQKAKDIRGNVYLKLNKEKDQDILDRLASVKSKQGYIKELIRRDIEAEKKEIIKEEKDG